LQIPDENVTSLVVWATGFENFTVSMGPDVGQQPLLVRLKIAPRVDSIQVSGTTIDTPASQQGSSLSLIPRAEIQRRNEASALDLLRYLPGLTVVQTGTRGSLASLFVRGGDNKFNQVQIDGVPVNDFGGDFDFAHVPTERLESIEVVRGAYSAVYGSYANSSVINFISRPPESSPNLDFVAEGGTYRERRFAVGGGGMLKGYGLSAYASRLDTNGPVANSDYRNENLSLNIGRNFGTQRLTLRANFNSHEKGFPGPYGSDPARHFSGPDLISRGNTDFSNYLVHYQIDPSARVRQELFGMVFLSNTHFINPSSNSFNKDLRGQFEARTIVSIRPNNTLAMGLALAREEVKNTFISNDCAQTFPLRRNQAGIYVENRWQLGARWFFNSGLRTEIIDTPAIPGNTVFRRPAFPSHTTTKVNPKVAMVYVLRQDREDAFGATRVHTSFGTGIRPPHGFAIAFTNNPALKPERTASVDIGVEQRLLHNRLSVETTYFYNRYYDLIVVLSGSLTHLSSFQSDNLANSRAQGVETEVRLRLLRGFSISGNYTFLDSEILALDGSSAVAPRFFRVGQPLVRRPRHSGGFVSSFQYGRLSVDFTGYVRGKTLDVEPNFGAFGGLFANPGYLNLGLNLNYRLARGLTLYTNARNLLNRSYEDVLGFPALKFNFVSGIRWNFSRE
jgi:outer membrane receptor protein involved in Fe transport